MSEQVQEATQVEPTTPVVTTEPEAVADPAGEEVIPPTPSALKESKRASVRALFRTVDGIRIGLVECWDTVRAYRIGGAEIDAKLATSDTEEASTYRDAIDQSSTESDAAEADYQAAIKPFLEARDARLEEIAAKLKTYKDAAIASENLDADIPSKADSEEAANEYKNLTLQMKTTQTNAKRGNVEFEFAVPSLRTGNATGGSGDFRPRYSAASVSKNGSTPVATNSLLVGDIAKQLGVQRSSFIASMLYPLKGDRDQWDKEEAGYELSFTVGPVNANPDKGIDGDMYTMNVVKAEATGGRKAADSE